MDRRQFIGAALAAAVPALGGGCRSSQVAKVMKPGEADMVGSHTAGSETFKPLIDEAVAKLLGRHGPTMIPAGTLPPPPKRICFVGVENRSSEEIGDFKAQIYQCIDTKILESQVFQPVSARFVEAGLMQTRLRPEQLFVPANMRAFVAAMEQQGQPFDYLLYATLTSGTTHQNKDYQRDYLLTMELVDLRSGQADKESAALSKGYYHSRVSKAAKSWNPFAR